MSITFRPHHFLCTLCFRGKGYSPAFVENFSVIVEQLNGLGGGNTKIEVVAETDSICAPCPNKRNKSCLTQEKISTLDQAHAAALQIKAGDSLTWKAAKELIARHITLTKFHQICASCNWKSLGICQNVITEFLESASCSKPEVKVDN
jgi:hypothetical protein